MQSIEELKAEQEKMFMECATQGMVPIPGVQIAPESAGSVGQFLINPSLDTLRMMTRDPFPYLGGATKAQQARWTTEEQEYADLYKLIQREFSAKKRKNVDSIVTYLKDMINREAVGFLPPPILWYQEEDIVVSTHFLAARRDAFPHAIDGSTRIAGVHRLAGEPGYREKMRLFKMPVIIIYGPEVDENVAAQIFGDVNFKAIPVDPSLAKSMDQRDIHVGLVKEIEKTIPSLSGRVSPRRQLTASDSALFTKYALYQSLRCFTDGVAALDKMFESQTLKPDTLNSVMGRTVDFWRDLEGIFGQQWLEPEGRERYLHMQAPVMKAISACAHAVYFPAVNAKKKADFLASLREIDWSRANPRWVGIATRTGRDRTLIVNNDAAVRDLAKALISDDDRLPRIATAA